MDERSGADDVKAALALLWRTDAPATPRPGPRPRVRLERIVEEAVAVADHDGMAGLSMRAVGERLGTTAMALYSHVPSKAVLVDLMVDHVHAELADLGPDAAGDWRPTLERWSADALEFHLRHPWLLRTPQVRAVMGPHATAAVDRLASIVARAGLDGARPRALISGLFHLVRGAADAIVEVRAAPHDGVTSDQAWWSAHQAALGELVPDLPERYPSLARLERTPVVPVGSPETFLERRTRAVFEHTVAMLLDGTAT